MQKTHFTVEEASRWLTCAQPVPLPLLQRLGKDCSMVCRIRGGTWVDVPVFGKGWPTERGYTPEVIREVFMLNPDTAPYVPAPAPRFVACIRCGHALTWLEHSSLSVAVDCPSCAAPRQFGPGVYVPEYNGVTLDEVKERQARAAAQRAQE